MKFILLSGKQGSGKTTLQKALAEEWYKKTKKGASVMNFADILYEMHDAVLSVLHQYLPPRPIAKDGPLLQMLGTDWGRNTIDKDIWVKLLVARAKRWNSANDQEALVIVGDCRFENEFEAFPGALRVRLECPENVRKERCTMWRENTGHPSETSLDSLAKAGRFDLYFSTDSKTTNDCVIDILSALERDTWVLERKT